MFSLVIAPFLVPAAFGVGYRGERRPVDAVIVAPASSTLQPETYPRHGISAARLLEVTADLEGARVRLRNQQIVLLVVAPVDRSQEFSAGKQTPISMVFNESGPVTYGYIRCFAERRGLVERGHSLPD